MSDTMRLTLGVELAKRVGERNGTDEDLELVREQGMDIFDSFADQFMEHVRQIRGDANCFHFTDPEIAFTIPALNHPTDDEIVKFFGNIKSYEDHSTEDEVTFRLATVLKTDEPSIDGAMYERRLMSIRVEYGIFGLQHLKWLVKNQDNPEAIPDPNVRAALKALVGNAYIDFSGLVVVTTDGYRFIPYAHDAGGRWRGSWVRLSVDFCRSGRVAVVGK